MLQQSLPNNARVYELAGFIDSDQGRWADATHNLERACELDPRNLPYLICFGATYRWLHDYEQTAKVIDQILALHPDRTRTRVIRAGVEIDWRADTRPLRAAIEKALANEPGLAEDPFVAEHRLNLALYDRDLDAAGSLAAALPLKQWLDAGFNERSRDFWLGVVARLKGDAVAARAAFMKARTQLEEEVRVNPDDMGLLSDLGLIDAGLGRKEEALSEARRAVDLLPITKDAQAGAEMLTNLAITYAWAGEKDLALKQLEEIVRIPSLVSYGRLRLHPFWDPLRGDPRFEKIVASLAPKETVSK